MKSMKKEAQRRTKASTEKPVKKRTTKKAAKSSSKKSVHSSTHKHPVGGEEAEKPLTFESVLKNSIYRQREVLYSTVPPTGFLHRVKQKNSLILELSPILMNSSAPAIFVYGPPGTGKTGIINDLTTQLQNEADKRDVKITPLYVNCSENRTTTVILVDLLNQMDDTKIYSKVGATRSNVVDQFHKVLNKEKANYLIILDEVDYVLRQEGDDLLYLMSRINNKVKSSTSTILISNDIKVQDYLKPRTQSTLGRIRIIFSPYNEQELFDILHDRAKLAFAKGVVSDDVLMHIAEIEAQRQGDARRALELLDTCAKVAMVENKQKITKEMVAQADAMLEQDSILKTIMSFTKHQRILYLSLIKSNSNELLSSGVYTNYVQECNAYGINPLTERSVRSFLVEFDNLGLIETEVGWLKSVKKKSKKIMLNVDDAVKNKIRKTLRDNI
jgi:cell division control protein 6